MEPDAKLYEIPIDTPDYAGNHVVEPGEVEPEPGLLGEIQARWSLVFGRALELEPEIVERARAGGSRTARNRLHRLVVAQATVRDPRVPVCEFGTAGLVVVDGKPVEFGKAQVFELLKIIAESGGFASRKTILKGLGDSDQPMYYSALHTKITRLRGYFEKAGVCVEVVQTRDGYALRRTAFGI